MEWVVEVNAERNALERRRPVRILNRPVEPGPEGDGVERLVGHVSVSTGSLNCPPRVRFCSRSRSCTVSTRWLKLYPRLSVRVDDGHTTLDSGRSKLRPKVAFCSDAGHDTCSTETFNFLPNRIDRIPGGHAALSTLALKRSPKMMQMASRAKSVFSHPSPPEGPTSLLAVEARATASVNDVSCSASRVQ